jgi:hypothetical protein
MKPLASLLALSAVLMIPAVASATIFPQKGIDAVRLQQTEKQVRAVAGKPNAIFRSTNQLGEATQWMYPGFSVLFQSGSRVTSVLTFSRRQRTKSGIGVGSTEAEVVAAYPKVDCQDVGRFRECLLGVPKPGGRLTNFSIKKGKVHYVDVMITTAQTG